MKTANHFIKTAFIVPLILCIACISTLSGCTSNTAGSEAGSNVSVNNTEADKDVSATDSKTDSKVTGNSSEADKAVSADASGNSSQTITLTDMIGRELSITPGSYKRVVCIGAGALRMYSYIGDISLLCGVEDIDNLSLGERPRMFDSVARPYVLAYSESFETLPSCGVGGPNAQTAEAEKILSCDPDIVISEYKDVEKENALEEQLGVPVVTLSTGQDGVFDNSFHESLRLLGTIFNNGSRVEELIEYITAEAKEISDRTAGIKEEDKPSVYICGLGNWGTTDHLNTSENYKPFEIAHIKNAVSGTGAPGVQQIEEEKFISIGDDIDIMIIDSAAVKNIVPLYSEDNTLLDCCRAWREGNAYLQMAHNAYYTNFELSLINTWYTAKAVYPELFEDIDIKDKSDVITMMFLGQPLADKINACPASYGGYQKIDTGSFLEN